MKITSIEYIKIKNFIPVKIIELYRKNKHIKTLEYYDTSTNLKDLKRFWRKENKQEKQKNKLNIIDNDGLIYNFTYLNNFTNLAENYQYYKKLLEYLQNNNTGIIEVQEKNKTKKYFKTFKIAYIK